MGARLAAGDGRIPRARDPRVRRISGQPGHPRLERRPLPGLGGSGRHRARHHHGRGRGHVIRSALHDRRCGGSHRHRRVRRGLRRTLVRPSAGGGRWAPLVGRLVHESSGR